jgi:hypothetical protein
MVSKSIWATGFFERSSIGFDFEDIYSMKNRYFQSVFFSIDLLEFVQLSIWQYYSFSVWFSHYKPLCAVLIDKSQIWFHISNLKKRLFSIEFLEISSIPININERHIENNGWWMKM